MATCKKVVFMILVLSYLSGNVISSVMFESAFTGANNAPISSLAEWRDASITGSTRVLDNNQGEFYMNKYGWIYSSIRASAAFNPKADSNGLRFEYTIKKMTDTSSQTTNNASAYLCLANISTWNGYSGDMNGEKLIWGLLWHKGTNNINMNFKIANKDGQSNDVGVVVYSNTISDVDMDGGDQIKLAMEIRDNAEANDVRVGYQIYDLTNSSWSSWTYSQWFAPTDNNVSLGLNNDANNLSAFGADWMTRWQASTYFYIESCSPDLRQSNIWVDDAVVTGNLVTPPNMPQIYLNISGTNADKIAQALGDFKRCFFEITGVGVPEANVPGFKPLRVAYIDSAINASHADPLGPSDYEIKIDSNEILLNAVTDLGLSNAFYGILEQWGCRWIIPSEIGEVIPQGAILQLTNGTYRKHISMDPRVLPGGDEVYNLWVSRNKMWKASYMSAQHYWFNAIPPSEYFATHPEYYALVNGQRVATQLCTTNRNVINLMIQKAKDKFAASPNWDSFPMDPEDNADFCQCENCKALDPEGYMSNGFKSMTNRVATFANAVAAGIANDYPDKKVGYYSYSSHSEPPVDINVHPNIFVPVCQHVNCCMLHVTPTQDCNMSMTFWNNIDDWCGRSSNIYSFQYLPICWTGSLPCPLYIEGGRLVKELHQRGVKGSLDDNAGSVCYSTNFPFYYMMLRMKADASLDPNAVLEDMCQSFFGTAGDVMNNYYQTLAQVTECTHPGRPRIVWSTWGYEEIFTPQMITTARQLLNQAQTLTSGSPVLSARVAMVERGQKYLEDYLAGMWAAKNKDYDSCIAAFAAADADIDALVAAGENQVGDAKDRMKLAKMKSIAKYMPDKLGFIRTWLVLGLFNNENRDAHYDSNMFPASMFPSGVIIGYPAVISGGDTVYWNQYASPKGQIDFTDAFSSSDPSWHFSSAYAAVRVTVPSAMTVQLRFDSAHPYRLYVNGTEVANRLGMNLDCPDNSIVSTNLSAGDNIIVWKGSETAEPQYMMRWGFFFRITDISGNLIPSMTTSADIAPVFESYFTGTNGTQMSSLPEWNSGYNNGCTMTLDGNKGKFAFITNGDRRASIEANETFNPASVTGGLRFKYSITSISDTSTYGTSNGGSTLYLANTSPWSSSGWEMAGEKLALDIGWHKDTNNVDVSFNIANKLAGDPVTDTGVAIYTNTVPNVDMDDGDKVTFAMEIRNNPSNNDVRIGYQIYDGSANSWSDWMYSPWYDPYDDANSLGLRANHSAFSAGWKTTWQNNTYFYIEPWSPDGRTTSLCVDDAVVSAILRPAASDCNDIWYYGYGKKTDYNRDCHVNLLDFNYLALHWLECSNPTDPNCEINFQ